MPPFTLRLAWQYINKDLIYEENSKCYLSNEIYIIEPGKRNSRMWSSLWLLSSNCGCKQTWRARRPLSMQRLWQQRLEGMPSSSLFLSWCIYMYIQGCHKGHWPRDFSLPLQAWFSVTFGRKKKENANCYILCLLTEYFWQLEMLWQSSG